MFDRLFDDVMTGVSGTALGHGAGHANGGHARGFSPAIDVRANGDEIVFTADVPGLRREDLEITLEDGVLTLKGQRRYEGTGKEKVWLGRGYGAFERSYTLPDTVDRERLEASLADGVLTIKVPQSPKAKPRKITIGVKSPADAPEALPNGGK
jgi:HSP20 family protein